ncbi:MULTISPECIES: Tex family protein [Sphingobacterium]|uniref:Tex family protein n=1 Tax=Sphingobacterium populi TaxID=1812824 RepID=A0ABW5U7Q4_9SPHI|nr:Tex family protein [Sphingobacterium sp. CFCC 11742]
MSPEISIAQELNIQLKQVQTTIQLLDEGATIPFIARYRKEMTGSLDEVQIVTIRDRMQQLRDLDKRKEAVLKSILEQEKLTPDLEAQIRATATMSALEDLYLPYKPKRKTRASIAREKGLLPLAEILFAQDVRNLQTRAEAFIDSEKGVDSIDQALAGARDIVAEIINEDPEVRTIARRMLEKKGKFVCQVIAGKEASAQKYRDYFDWTELIKDAPSHRILAMRRGEKEELLSLGITVDESEVLPQIEKKYITSVGEAADQLRLAIQDSYKRLLKPSMENEMRVSTRQQADEEAIKVFAENVRQLLLAAPLGAVSLIAIDPGFRTGCKTVVLNEQGSLLENTAIFPHNGAGGEAEAKKTIIHLVDKYHVGAIAIGNGTAGRETETFIRNLSLTIPIVMVNESGASIYSASEVAREEFPEQDITVRGAVSIGRRLMDPLAELVKIDPKSIGVGQYQHDVDQNKLQSALDDTVISCVNAVGVELNTASKQILAYVSGLGPALAQQIVNYRRENGPFTSRKELKKVPRLGAKAFEQSAAFLRIRDAKYPLDASAVHPERYALVEMMAKDLSASVQELLRDDQLRKQIDPKRYVSSEVGLPTLHDILAELAKPGLDPRDQFEQFSFTEGVNSVKDLRVGMRLPGIVTNITNFGAFVDIGVHQDGMVHLSQLANRYVQDPREVVKVQQKVEVTVIEVDEQRNRISLSMKNDDAQPRKRQDRVDRPTDKSAKHTNKQNKKQQHAGGDMATKLAQLASKFKS